MTYFFHLSGLTIAFFRGLWRWRRDAFSRLLRVLKKPLPVSATSFKQLSRHANFARNPRSNSCYLPVNYLSCRKGFKADLIEPVSIRNLCSLYQLLATSKVTGVTSRAG
jgi:hypothetical protein